VRRRLLSGEKGNVHQGYGVKVPKRIRQRPLGDDRERADALIVLSDLEERAQVRQAVDAAMGRLNPDLDVSVLFRSG
jgi:hypothetical protein